jgi:hypothetical protein
MNSFIEERRENILEEKNTGQQDVLDILENLHPAINELIFKEPLSGDIDFSILKECNFTNITSIKFVPGNITSIRNLPENITELSCPNNLLIDLENLPASIVVLEIPENGLKYLDFKNLQKLKSLNINKNKFVNLTQLPASLENLYCNNNKIKELDLEGVENLKTLHCENNDMFTIIHYPSTISDLKMDNNPNLEYEKEETNDTNQSIEVTEAIHRFYELKNKYESNRLKIKRELFKKTATKKSAKRIIQTLRYKCVNCGNPGEPEGTIFSIKDRNFTAICGAKNKCNLNIKIFAGYFSDLYFYYKEFKEGVEENKSEIIKQKLDTLFNYIDERTSIEIFKREMKEYTDNNIVLKQIIQSYNEIYSNEERNIKIEEKKREIDEINSKINKLLMEYRKTENKELLNEAIRNHIDNLLPATRTLGYLVFELCEMEIMKKGKEDINILIQKPNRIQKMDYTFHEPAKVIKFIVK